MWRVYTGKRNEFLRIYYKSWIANYESSIVHNWYFTRHACIIISGNLSRHQHRSRPIHAVYIAVSTWPRYLRVLISDENPSAAVRVVLRVKQTHRCNSDESRRDKRSASKGIDESARQIEPGLYKKAAERKPACCVAQRQEAIRGERMEGPPRISSAS